MLLPARICMVLWYTICCTLIREEHILKVSPYLLLLSILSPLLHIHTCNLIDSNQPCPQVVQSYTYLQQIPTSLCVVDLQLDVQSTKRPLHAVHSPFSSLTVWEQLSVKCHSLFYFCGAAVDALPVFKGLKDVSFNFISAAGKCCVGDEVVTMRCV